MENIQVRNMLQACLKHLKNARCGKLPGCNIDFTIYGLENYLLPLYERKVELERLEKNST